MELRFIEKVVSVPCPGQDDYHQNKIVRVLQFRDSPLAHWDDVPIVTLKQLQNEENQVTSTEEKSE